MLNASQDTLSSSSSISCALCRPPAKECLGWLSLPLHADWHLSHHALDIILSEHKTCMSYPLSVFFHTQGAEGLTPEACGHSSEVRCRAQANALCLIWALAAMASRLSSLHPHPAAGILGIQVRGSPRSSLGWVSSYQSAAVSAAGLAELTGAARQEKAAGWAGWQLVMATVKHMLLTAFSAEAWLQRSGTSAFYNF